MIRRSAIGLMVRAMLIVVSSQGTASAMGASASLEWGHDDNLFNAPDAYASRSSALAALSLGWQGGEAIGPRSGVALAVGAEWQRVVSNDALSSVQADGSATLWWLLGHGFAAPALYLDFGAGHREYQSRLRDQEFAHLSLTLVQRLTTQIDGQLGIRHQRSDARDAVFDQSRTDLGAGLQWRPVDALSLDISYDWVRGEVPVSIGGMNGQLAALAADQVADDAVPGWTAYRLDSEGRQLRLGLSFALSQAMSLRLQGDWSDRQSRSYAPASASSMAYKASYERLQSSLSLQFTF